jgi:hypothetical protein
MSWSYDENNLTTDTANGRLNSVRLLLGDTDTLDQQVQDEEIFFALGVSNDSIYSATSWCARFVAAKYSRRVDTQLDGALSAKYSDLNKHYMMLSQVMEDQAKKQGAAIGVKAGGISKTTVDNVRQNTDRIEPSFRRDRFRNPPNYSGDDYSDFYNS